MKSARYIQSGSTFRAASERPAQSGMLLSCLKRIMASGSVLSFFHATTCFITWQRMCRASRCSGLSCVATPSSSPGEGEGEGEGEG